MRYSVSRSFSQLSEPGDTILYRKKNAALTNWNLSNSFRRCAAFPLGEGGSRKADERGYPGADFPPWLHDFGAVPSIVTPGVVTLSPRGKALGAPAPEVQIPVCTGNDTERVWAKTISTALCTYCQRALPAAKFQFVSILRP